MRILLGTIKGKLYALVFCSIVMRVIAFLFLPNTGSNLAPDEGNYGQLTEWVSQNKPADEYPYSSLYIISRSLIVPASLLHQVGVEGLNAVRVVASLYGFLSFCLAVK